MAQFVLTNLAKSVLSQTVKRIIEHLIHDAASLESVRDDVVLLQYELESLKVFIKSADAKQHHKQHHDQRLQRLILIAKDVASDAEDVVETYIHRVGSSYFKAFHISIQAKLSSIRKRIKVINKSMQAYGITSVAVGEVRMSSSIAELLQSLRRLYPNEKDKDVTSLDQSTRVLTAELTKEEEQLRIVSVVGMGGLGKTTLAKEVFRRVKQHFDSTAWVFLSQKFVPKDVFIEILTQISGKDKVKKWNASEEHALIDSVKEEPKEKWYLLVVDDIWTTEAWDSIKHASPQGKKGSKFLFTTRNKEVAKSTNPLSSPVEPPILTWEESWELLQQKAFPRDIVGDHDRQLGYKKVGMQIAEKCEGLPFAVTIVGGLLRTKTTVKEWEKVLEDVNSYFDKVQSHQEYEGVNEILGLSYYDLPYHLRPRFLYLGNFPDDSEIPKRKLVQLWIGEGLIPRLKLTRRTREKPLEAVAEGFLEEQIHRCMVQVEKRDHMGIVVKTCCMHDLIRDFCISKAREENFAQIIS